MARTTGGKLVGTAAAAALLSEKEAKQVQVPVFLDLTKYVQRLLRQEQSNNDWQAVRIFQSDSHKDNFVVQGSSGASFATRDCGKSFRVIYHKEKAIRFLFHPTKERVLVGLFDDGNKTILKLTQDGGDTWKQIYSDIADVNW